MISDESDENSQVAKTPVDPNQCAHAQINRDTHGWRCDDCLRTFFPSGETGAEQEAVRLRTALARIGNPLFVYSSDEDADEDTQLSMRMADARAVLAGESSASEASAPISVKDEREIGELRAALKVAKQALAEFSHAQECGPEWYTRGESGMYAQVRLWMRRGHEAISKALGPYDDNGRYLKEMPPEEPKGLPGPND